MLLFSLPVFLISMITTADGFIIVRLFIGVSLCTFVCCQFWIGSMFNVRIVGTANALGAGWGNMGGGATAIIMPAIQVGIASGGVSTWASWRWAFFVPGGIFILTGIIIYMFGEVSSGYCKPACCWYT